VEAQGGPGPPGHGPAHRAAGETQDLDDGSPYPIITGDYAAAEATWASRPLHPGTPLQPPTPVFKKLDPSVVEDELRRLEEGE
jgi:methionyl-tRNA synthetase